MINLWKIMFGVFFFSTLLASVWFMVQIDWRNLNTFEVIKNIGILGGLAYLGDFFKKEMDGVQTKGSVA